MLTASEKRWLIKRAKKWANFCDVCIVGNENCKLMHFRKKCPTNIQVKDLLEALEFESRVAAKLATDENCGIDEDCQPDMPFGWGRLKAARLAVEEEMDGTD